MDEPEAAEPRPMSPFGAIGWALGVLFVYVALRTITARFRAEESIDLVNAVGCQVVVYLLGLFLILRVHAPQASIRGFLALRHTHVLMYPIGALMGVTLYGLADGVYELITRRFPTGDEGKIVELIAGASMPRRALFFFIIVLLGPAVEEVLFRGALVGPLKKTSSTLSIVLVTAVTFAVVHLEWQIFAPIAIVGAAMAILRLASGSLFPSFLLHATLNGVQFVLILRERSHGADDKLVLPILALGAAGTAVLMLLLRLVARTTDATAARALDDAT